MQKLVYVLVCVLLFFTGWAQQKTVSGTVTDNNNAPVAGASVSVKGTGAGTQTDSAGHFSITVPAGSKSLVISHVGLAPQEISVEGKSQISVALNSTANNLNDVVVVGYTTQRKQDLTGAVAVVEMTPAVKNNTSGKLCRLCKAG